MGGQPVPPVPDALDKFLNWFFIINRGNILYKQISLPFISLDLIPYTLVHGYLLIGLEFSLSLCYKGQDLRDLLQQDNHFPFAHLNDLLKHFFVYDSVQELEGPEHHTNFNSLGVLIINRKVNDLFDQVILDIKVLVFIVLLNVDQQLIVFLIFLSSYSYHALLKLFAMQFNILEQL